MTKSAIMYGNSLYEIAIEENEMDRFLEELTELQKAFKENPEYITLLSEPSLAKEKRLGLAADAFEGKVHKYILNFLKVLIENGDVKEIVGSIAAFRLRYFREHGIAIAKVTTASKLDLAQLASLKKKLEEMSGKTIIIEEKIDSKYLAGINVELDGVSYDGTALGRLNAIRKKVNDITL